MPAAPVHRRRLSALLGLALLMSSSPGAAHAVVATVSASEAPTPARAQQLVGDVREAMATGKIGNILATAGIEAAAPSAGTTTSPISELSTAITEASEMIRATLPSDGARTHTRVLRALRMRRPLPDLLDAKGHEAVDRAAALVASAIDRALPRLAAMEPPESSGEQVTGCDIVDQPPALCVAGTGTNIIPQDYALVVDFDGNDVHNNSAGGADVFSNGLPVSVTIDLGGDDTYSTPSPTASGSQVAQGAAIAGAGFLVDMIGDDTYRIASDGPFAIAIGQGKALSGVGVLADFLGNDDYTLSARGAGYPTATGQGDGAHGPGILLDLGGNDQHLITSTATDFYQLPLGGVAPPAAVASGLGSGAWGYINFQTPPPVHADGSYRQMGFGLFADAGGMDELDIEAIVPDPPDDTFFGPGLIALPGAVAFGVGAAQAGGVGLAVLGSGRTYTSITTTTQAQLAAALSAGMGFGDGGGLAALSDAGGDDWRFLQSDVAVERHEHAADGCSDCESPQAWAQTDISTVRGMGSGDSTGLGLLEDDGGDDRYFASAFNIVDTTFDDERATGNAGKSISKAGPVHVTVQGAGEGTGVGVLRDAAGNDRYEVAAGAVAHAKASQPGDGPQPEGTAVAGDSVVLAHAAARTMGSGSLQDLGGADQYLVSSTVVAESKPETSEQPGTPTAGVLASVDEGSSASFLDRDDGAADTFSASPAQAAACTGTRGEGAWADCGGTGFGLVG